MNRYGKGPGILNRRRAYLVEAECRVRVGFCARSPEVIRLPRRFAIEAACRVSLSCLARTYEEAEDWFYEYSGAVEDRFPEMVLEVTDVYEDN